MKEDKPKESLYCSFCGKDQHEVITLIAGPVVFICDECVELSVRVVADIKRKRKDFEEKLAAEQQSPPPDFYQTPAENMKDI